LVYAFLKHLNLEFIMTLAVKKTPNIFHSPLSTSLTNPIVFVSYFPVMPHNNQQSSGDDQLGPPKADFSAPPPYEANVGHGQQVALPAQMSALTLATTDSGQMQIPMQMQVQLPGQADLMNAQLPPEIHGKLPTYEEVQMEKSLNGELPPAFLTLPSSQQLPPPPNPLLPPNPLRDGAAAVRSAQPALTFIAIDASDPENSLSTTDNLLGTDIMFITAFIVTFISCVYWTVSFALSVTSTVNFHLHAWFFFIFKYMWERQCFAK